MFGNTPRKKQFSYTTLKSLKAEDNRPLKQKMKFSSYSSQEKKPSKKKMMFFAVLLLIVLAYILNYGFRNISTEVKINENELEKVNG
jgi:hypothetical protein